MLPACLFCYVSPAASAPALMRHAARAPFARHAKFRSAHIVAQRVREWRGICSACSRAFRRAILERGVRDAAMRYGVILI